VDRLSVALTRKSETVRGSSESRNESTRAFCWPELPACPPFAIDAFIALVQVLLLFSVSLV